MGYRIELKDLPPKYQEQATNQVRAQNQRRGRVNPSLATPQKTETRAGAKYHSENVEISGGLNKYGITITEV